jgi:hypothetical protein
MPRIRKKLLTAIGFLDSIVTMKAGDIVTVSKNAPNYRYITNPCRILRVLGASSISIKDSSEKIHLLHRNWLTKEK